MSKGTQMAADDRGLHVSRRRFVQGVGAVGLGLVTGCGRLPFPGQPPAPKVPTIGWLSPESADPLERWPVENLDAFRQSLAALGYVEGQNVIFETRLALPVAGLREAAADLVRLPVDVLVTSGPPATLAAQAATSTIPIVFTSGGDPVGSGLVASLARPGGNATGLANLNPEFSGKRLELLAQGVPGLRRVAFLWDALSPASNVQELEAATQALGVRLQLLEIRDVADYEAAFAAAGAEQADALMTAGGINNRNSARVISLAARSRLPAMYPIIRPVRDGGLMAYGANELDLRRRAATYVDKILKGTHPADLPVEQPMRFDLAINLQTAQALRLTIPDRVLLQATEVIH
jgi:putative tryptophan/tyrosine transport system substrate-binding protein